MIEIPTSATILVVDDEPESFEVVEGLLWQEHYDLTHITSGTVALDQLQEKEIDVILMDIKMPGQDGIETCRQIKAHPLFSSIPLIMVTALNSKADLARSLEAGADDFISKPMNGLELRARIRSMLRIKHQYEALQSTLKLREDLSTRVVNTLRTPMTIILSGSRALLQGSDERTQTRAQMVLEAGQQVQGALRDLLILSKMEQGKVMAQTIPVDLNALVHKVIMRVQGNAEVRSVTLQTQLTETQCSPHLDIDLLDPMLENLITTAIDLSPANSVIQIKTDYPENRRKGDKAKVQAILKITDQGQGISPTLRQQILERPEIKRWTESITNQIGLILAFCRLVVEAHDGRLWMEDNRPQGTIVTIEF